MNFSVFYQTYQLLEFLFVLVSYEQEVKLNCYSTNLIKLGGPRGNCCKYLNGPALISLQTSDKT